MKKIQLIAMNIRHFKGIKELVLTADGYSIEVYGPNGKGKTTIFDAFTWGLFGKNSQGETKFQMKPVDADNQEIHNLETEVELTLQVNDQRITFKRVLFEKWSKPNGSNEKSFTNSQKFYVDDVPVSTKKAYDAAVNEVLDEKAFKLLTSTTFFNEQLEWQERRKILFELAGELTDEEVMASNVELKPLIDKLNGKKPHERKAQVDEQRKTLKQRIAEISPRIDEAARNIPEVAANTEADQAQLLQLNNEIAGLQAQKVAIQSGAAITNKQAEIKSLESDIRVYQSEFNQNAGTEVTKLQVALQEKQANVSIANSKVQQLQNEIQNKHTLANQTIAAKERTITLRTELLAQHKTIKEQVYIHPESGCTCPTCKQDLPVEQVEVAKQTALEQFNLRKAKQLDDIKQQGMPLKEQIIGYDNQLSTLSLEVTKLKEQLEIALRDLDAHQLAFEKVQKQLETARTQAPTLDNDAKLGEMQQRLVAVKQQLITMQEHANESLSGIDSEISALNTRKFDIEARLSQFANVVATQKRIAELEEQQQALNEQYEELEHTLYLINQFERTKASMVTERVNNLFQFVSFKLFHEQMEGGIKETCETLYKGVSYQNGLNTAAKTNAGIDVINALQKHNGTIAPVFLDNRESVTDLIHTDAQTVSLIVSGGDTGLRIEKVGATSEGAPMNEVAADKVEQPSLFESEAM